MGYNSRLMLPIDLASIHLFIRRVVVGQNLSTHGQRKKAPVRKSPAMHREIRANSILWKILEKESDYRGNYTDNHKQNCSAEPSAAAHVCSKSHILRFVFGDCPSDKKHYDTNASYESANSNYLRIQSSHQSRCCSGSEINFSFFEIANHQKQSLQKSIIRLLNQLFPGKVRAWSLLRM